MSMISVAFTASPSMAETAHATRRIAASGFVRKPRTAATPSRRGVGAGSLGPVVRRRASASLEDSPPVMLRVSMRFVLPCKTGASLNRRPLAQFCTGQRFDVRRARDWWGAMAPPRRS